MLPQHLEALKKANDVRSATTAARRKIMSGELTLDESLEHPDLQPEQLHRALCAMKRWGPARARKAIRRAGIRNELIRVREMTDRQKRLILTAVADRDFYAPEFYRLRAAGALSEIR